MFPIPPPVVFSVVVASAYAGLFNLWQNGSPRDLILYLLAAWLGFALGQGVGWLFHLRWAMIGSVYLLEGTLCCWVLLFLTKWLRMPREE
jgi:hypothetical protein